MRRTAGEFTFNVPCNVKLLDKSTLPALSKVETAGGVE